MIDLFHVLFSIEEYEGSDVDSDFGPMEDDDFDPFAELETKTRFTNYSMSSSVIRRNKGLSDLDDQFEKVCNTLANTIVS